MKNLFENINREKFRVIFYPIWVALLIAGVVVISYIKSLGEDYDAIMYIALGVVAVILIAGTVISALYQKAAPIDDTELFDFDYANLTDVPTQFACKYRQTPEEKARTGKIIFTENGFEFAEKTFVYDSVDTKMYHHPADNRYTLQAKLGDILVDIPLNKYTLYYLKKYNIPLQNQAELDELLSRVYGETENATAALNNDRNKTNQTTDNDTNTKLNS